MAQEEVGDARMLLPLDAAQSGDVGHYQLPPVLGGEGAVAAVLDRVPVSQVVLAAHQKALSGQESGRCLIAADVLPHPVYDLHHAPRLLRGQPRPGVAGAAPIAGRKSELLKLTHDTGPLSC